MPGTQRLAQRRFEPGWLLAGLAWGVILGVGTAAAPMLLVVLSGGGTAEPDAWVVTLLWLTLFAVTGAMYGGVLGLVLGVAVMLAVGRDPEVRAARRKPATVVLLIAPLALLALFYL